MARSKPACIDLSQIPPDLRDLRNSLPLGLLTNMINLFDEGIEIIDSHGIFRFYNTMQEKLNNVHAEEVVGKHVTAVYNLSMNSSLLLQALKTGTPIYDYHQQYTTMTGKFVNILCSVFPIVANGQTIGAMAITKDYSGFLETTERMLIASSPPAGAGSAANQQTAFAAIVGQSSQLAEALKWAGVSAQSESNVLIYGETGTGKELFANGIHYASKRSTGPFITINCAAMPESLLESLLFGTVKGSFTGAVDKMGLLEQAHGGTILLDEINSMPLSLQGKLLRVLEERKVRKLGGKEEVRVDIRLISTCNEDPVVAINKGTLRQDLFYRLAVVYISIPPLRDRLDDLDLLIHDFIQTFNRQFRKDVSGVEYRLTDIMKQYSWPGNVRQLKHCIECAMNIVAAGESYITLEHIPTYLRQDFFKNPAAAQENAGYRAEAAVPLDIWAELKHDEIQRLLQVLRAANGNISEAARQLGVSRQSLQYKLKKYGIN